MLSVDERSRILGEKLRRQYIPPNEWFTLQTNLYSKFDVDGIPTHDVSGNEIGKCNRKKMQKDWLKQKKLYDTVTNPSS